MRSGLRVFPAVLGLVFVLSVALKAVDATAFAVQVSVYGVVSAPWAVKGVALAVIGVEACLGVALVAGFALRRVTLPAVMGVLAGFTVLLGWAWAFRGLEDCGCFGKYLSMGPGASIAKNLALMAMAGFAWRGLGKEGRVGGSIFGKGEMWRLGVSLAGGAAVVLFALVSPFATPEEEVFGAAAGSGGANSDEGDGSGSGSGVFAKYSLEWEGESVDLGQGTYLAAMLSDTCDHCAASVGDLNRLAGMPGAPQVVGLVLGEEKSFRAFRQSTGAKFPMRLIPVLEFFNLIGSAPPRFILVRDGEEIAHWDDQPPSESTLLEAASGSSVEANSPGSSP